MKYEDLKLLVESNGGTIRRIKKAIKTTEVIAICLDGKIGVFPNVSLIGPGSFHGLENLTIDPEHLESASSLDALEQLQNRLG